MTTLGLVLDLLMVLLLGAVLAYAVILNRRLTQLRSNKDELARVINAFNEATQRAESSIPRLRKAADEIKSQLEDRIEKAVGLKDDLAFMIDRSDSMANRLESSVRMARGETMGGSSSAPPRMPSAPRPMSASRPVVSGQTLSGFSAQAAQPSPLPPAPPQPASPAARTQAPVRQAAPVAQPAAQPAAQPVRKEPRLAPEARPGQDDMDDRSEAERALLRALQSAR